MTAPGSIRLDKVVYRPGDCATVTFAFAPGAASRGGASLVADFGAAAKGGKDDHVVTVRLVKSAAGPGTWTGRSCVPLKASSSSPHALAVHSGDGLVVLAREDKGRPLALGFATIAHGRADGHFHFNVDASLRAASAPPSAHSSHGSNFPAAFVVDPKGRRAGFVENQVILLDLCDPPQILFMAAFACAAVAEALAVSPIPALTCAEVATLITLADYLSNLEKALGDAEAAGVVVVAGAGNDHADSDDERFVPCVYDTGICVGGLDTTSDAAGRLVAASFSNFGSAVKVWAPGVRVTTMPDPDTVAVSQQAGTSVATPVVTGTLALVRAINPSLDPKAIRALLGRSLCKAGQERRFDGGTCTPSSDATVDQAGYLDLLNLIYLARDSAGKPNLAPCTGGWDAGEGTGVIPANDDFLRATPLRPFRPIPGPPIDFPDTPPGDLSIHALAPAHKVDEDWYKLTFDPSTPVVGMFADISITLPDPTLGPLSLSLFQSCNPRNPPIPVPVLATRNEDGTKIIRVKIQSDTFYYARVSTAAPDTTNCYSKVSVRVLELTPPPPACQE
jgi:hypothetical protein